jgi:hypothetical protein
MSAAALLMDHPEVTAPATFDAVIVNRGERPLDYGLAYTIEHWDGECRQKTWHPRSFRRSRSSSVPVRSVVQSSVVLRRRIGATRAISDSHGACYREAPQYSSGKIPPTGRRLVLVLRQSDCGG